MFYFLLMACVGLAMFIGARFLDRAVTLYEPRLPAVEPAIPMICFVAKSAGMMISVAGLGAAVWTAWV